MKQLISSAKPETVRQALDSLTSEERALVGHSWRMLARDSQVAPDGDWFCWLVLAGRGFGKTRMGAEWVIERAMNGYGPIALIGQTAGDVRDTMIELGESSIMKVSPPWFKPKYEPSKRRLTWPNGITATTFAGDEPDQLRGPQHETVWADEPAKWKYADDAWSNMEFGLRLGNDPRAMATTTPRPIKLIKELVADPSTAITRGHTMENGANLSDRFLHKMREKYEGTRLGRQELHGEILDDNPNALFKRADIDAARLKPSDMPQLARIVVAIDPAVTNEEDSDETGIIVAGMTRGTSVKPARGYILHDGTVKGSPGEWGLAAVQLYHQYKADRIVAEVNNGGDMVEHVITTTDRRCAFRKVHASRGKALRAEPVGAMYEQKRIHHVGYFADLEMQMCEFDPTLPKGSQKSPDRMDALVWALTDLLLTNQSSGYAGAFGGDFR